MIQIQHASSYTFHVIQDGLTRRLSHLIAKTLQQISSLGKDEKPRRAWRYCSQNGEPAIMERDSFVARGETFLTVYKLNFTRLWGLRISEMPLSRPPGSPCLAVEGPRSAVSYSPRSWVCRKTVTEFNSNNK